MSVKKVYLASGWFNERDDRILTQLEDKLCSIEGLQVYRPRKDGIALTSEEFHDHELRRKVFDSNVVNIDTADFLVVNLDCGSPRLDTGTVWECARAVAMGLPVVVYNEASPSLLKSRLGDLVNSIMIKHVHSLEELERVVKGLQVSSLKYPSLQIRDGNRTSPTVVCDDQEGDFLATILDTLSGVSVVPNPKCSESAIENVVLNASYFILPTDTKDPVITWYMSVAYYLGIPILTYTDKNLPLNLMLIFSVKKHIIGLTDLRETLSKITRFGIDTLPEYSTAGVKVY